MTNNLKSYISYFYNYKFFTPNNFKTYTCQILPCLVGLSTLLSESIVAYWRRSIPLKFDVMKTHLLFCVVLILWACCSKNSKACAIPSPTLSGSVVNADDPENLAHGNYLVIGVFAYQDNAESFREYVRTQGFPAKYGYYPSRGYYYVYTLTSDSAAQVVDACLHLRESSEFADAWVLRAYETNDQDSLGWDKPVVNVPNETVNERASVRSVNQQAVATDESAPAVAQLPIWKETEPGHLVYFRTINQSNEPVTAVVKVVDGAQAQSIKDCQAHQPEVLESSRLLSDQVQLIPYAIGYRKTTFDLPLNEPVNDSTASYVAVSHDTIRVTMPLEKLKKGDVQAMYNTYFYGNASVMREHSRYELEALQHYLQENPTVKVMLHGHTNGNARGVVYLYSKEHGNFFHLRRSNDYKKTGVSSMKLSKLRAETIRQYLIKQGVVEDRIETKGWGGKKMLYDAKSPLAKNNIRVEIEVLSE